MTFLDDCGRLSVTRARAQIDKSGETLTEILKASWWTWCSVTFAYTWNHMLHFAEGCRKKHVMTGQFAPVLSKEDDRRSRWLRFIHLLFTTSPQLRHCSLPRLSAFAGMAFWEAVAAFRLKRCGLPVYCCVHKSFLTLTRRENTSPAVSQPP